MPINMRTLFLLTMIVFSSTVVQSQKLKLPEKLYVLVIGKYKFSSETVIEKSPDLSQGFASENFGGLQLEMSKDTIKSRPIYLNGDSLRTWTYLFQNDTFRINYPRKIQKLRVRNILSDTSYIRYDTTDHLDINKLVDTINLEQLKDLLLSEIQIYNGIKKLKVRRIGIRLVWPDGKQFYTNYEKKRIADYPQMVERAKSLSPGGYIIIDSVWFYNLEREQDQMTGAIGWLVR
jgi:hypothetical protein